MTSEDVTKRLKESFGTVWDVGGNVINEAVEKTADLILKRILMKHKFLVKSGKEAAEALRNVAPKMAKEIALGKMLAAIKLNADGDIKATSILGEVGLASLARTAKLVGRHVEIAAGKFADIVGDTQVNVGAGEYALVKSDKCAGIGGKKETAVGEVTAFGSNKENFVSNTVRVRAQKKIEQDAETMVSQFKNKAWIKVGDKGEVVLTKNQAVVRHGDAFVRIDGDRILLQKGKKVLFKRSGSRVTMKASELRVNDNFWVRE